MRSWRTVQQMHLGVLSEEGVVDAHLSELVAAQVPVVMHVCMFV